jgi:hypothetical protein
MVFASTILRGIRGRRRAVGFRSQAATDKSYSGLTNTLTGPSRALETLPNKIPFSQSTQNPTEGVTP